MRMRALEVGSSPSLRFEAGFRLFGAGLRQLRRAPSLWPSALVPTLLALVCVAVVASLSLEHFGSLVAWTSSLLPVFEAGGRWSGLWSAPATFLVWIAGGLLVVVAQSGAIVAALLAVNLVCAPWLERISWRVERLERARRGGAVEDEGGGLERAAWSLIAAGLRTATLAVVAGALFFVGLVVPGAVYLTTPLLAALALFWLPIEALSPAFDRHRTSIFARLRFVSTHAATLAGFGACAFAAALVPGLNLLLMPALVAGGTLFVVRLEVSAEEALGGDLASFSEAEG